MKLSVLFSIKVSASSTIIREFFTSSSYNPTW